MCRKSITLIVFWAVLLFSAFTSADSAAKSEKIWRATEVSPSWADTPFPYVDYEWQITFWKQKIASVDGNASWWFKKVGMATVVPGFPANIPGTWFQFDNGLSGDLNGVYNLTRLPGQTPTEVYGITLILYRGNETLTCGMRAPLNVPNHGYPLDFYFPKARCVSTDQRMKTDTFISFILGKKVN